MVDIHANRDKCIGAGQCVLSLPDVFDQDASDGRVELLVESVDESAVEELDRVLEMCPVHALTRSS